MRVPSALCIHFLSHISQSGASRLSVVNLDVTSDASVDTAFKATEKILEKAQTGLVGGHAT
jgi:hypothetical protein